MIVSGRIEKPGSGSGKKEVSGRVKSGPLRFWTRMAALKRAAGGLQLAPLQFAASAKTEPYVRAAGGLEEISNIAYAAAGLLLLLLEGNAYGLILLALCVASWGYHRTRKRSWQHADRAMVLSSVFALVALAYLSPPWMVAGVALGWAIERYMPNLEVPVILSALAIVWRLKEQAWAPLALIALAAVLVWIAERYKDATRPSQALAYDILHSIWHILSAGALYMTAHLLL